jgi:hypothetical protein
LEIPRESRSITFSDFFSSDREAQENYAEGLIGLGSFLLSFAFLWYVVLLVLKLKGHEAGCAAGRAFGTEASTSTKSLSETDDSNQDNVSAESSVVKYDDRELDSNPPDDDNERSGCCSDHSLHLRQRQYRTRLAYFFFAFLSLVCSFLLLTSTYQPLEDATDNASRVAVEGEMIVDSIESVIQAVESAALIADDIMVTISLNFTELCPDVAPEYFGNELGVDPRDAVLFLDREYDNFLDFARENMVMVQEVASQARGVLGYVDDSIQTTEDRLWALPFLIAFIIVLTVISTSGVFVAMCREPLDSEPTTSFIERFLAWGILPAMIIWTLLGWTLVICFCFGTVIASDVCVSGGGPDATIQTILEVQRIDPTTTELITAYTGVSLESPLFRRRSLYVSYRNVLPAFQGCRGENPVQEIIDAEGILEDYLELMRTRLEEAEAVGYETIKQKCGPGNNVDSFFSGVTMLESQLTAVRVALSDASDMVSCPKINSLYTSTMHVSVCTDFAAANANGFLMFLLVSISSMILITLRASWRMS